VSGQSEQGALLWPPPLDKPGWGQLSLLPKHGETRSPRKCTHVSRKLRKGSRRKSGTEALHPQLSSVAKADLHQGQETLGYSGEPTTAAHPQDWSKNRVPSSG
jgi:hypothetical protein